VQIVANTVPELCSSVQNASGAYWTGPPIPPGASAHEAATTPNGFGVATRPTELATDWLNVQLTFEPETVALSAERDVVETGEQAAEERTQTELERRIPGTESPAAWMRDDVHDALGKKRMNAGGWMSNARSADLEKKYVGSPVKQGTTRKGKELGLA
jgi:hypothetical protein